MSQDGRQIYCAGPLFNEAERREMGEIARIVEGAGYDTFLPHRDGLEFARLLPELQEIVATPAVADALLQKAIFSLDLFQLLTRSDGVVANLNGRVPDEGAVVEAALGWLAGKAVVLYKCDSRSVLSGSDNPMLVGLGDFRVVSDLNELPRALDHELHANREDRLKNVLEVGRHIADLRHRSPRGFASTLLALVAEST